MVRKLLKDITYLVVQRDSIGKDITRILLQAPKQDALRYHAGQYVKVVHPDGKLSPLSIACSPHDYSFIELHIAHPDSNHFAREILLKISAEKKLTLRGPYGCSTEFAAQRDQPIIFLARGTGFAPVKSIVEELTRLNTYPSMHLYWSATAPEELYLHELAQGWMNELQNFSYTPVLSRPHTHWQGKIGLLQHVILENHSDLSPYRIYASAPESIVHDALQDFLTAGLKRENYFSDVFGYDHLK